MLKIICKICNKEYPDNRQLGVHINQMHNISSKDYYDKFVKQSNDGNLIWM
jgi:hypothetical protein